MKKFLSWLLFSLISGIFPTVSHATCDGNCIQYCGDHGSHGYCIDYINTRLHATQSGDAKNWTGNIDSSEVRPDDVAIFDFGTYGHVAVVDSVDGDNLTIREWNWGSNLVNAACGVTNEYGTLHSPRRIVSKSSVSRFWRPSKDSGGTTVTLSYRLVGNVAWYPPNKSCANAERWVYFSGGYPNGGMTIGSNTICQQEEYNMMMALGGINSDWWYIIYGIYNLDEVLQCSK